MHVEGTGRILSCDHGTHTDEQMLQCLADQWRISVPQLVAMLAALVLSHTERAAARDTASASALPGWPTLERQWRACEWCDLTLPPETHHARRYCPDRDCRRLAYNAWQRAGRPARRSADIGAVRENTES